MRALFFILLAIQPVWASACETNIFTHENLGENQTATFSGEMWTIKFKDGKTVNYHSVSVGTGIPYRALTPINENAPVIPHRMVGDLLVIDMEVYEPKCGE